VTDLNTIELVLDHEIPPILAGEVVQKVRYSIREVADFRVDPARPARVFYRLAGGADGTLARRRLEEVIGESCRGFRAIPVKRLWERHRRRTGRRILPDPWRRLAARGELFVEGPGQVALGGTALALLEHFDGVFAGWARRLGFRAAEFPALIPVATLARAEYFDSFPQYLTFAAPLPEDIDAIGRAVETLKGRRRAAGAAGDAGDAIEGLAPARQVLSPAVCYHLYPQIADRALSRLPLRVTARGKCFRYETVNMTPLERQWDFWMRELVYVGTPGGVERFRTLLIEQAIELVEALDLDGAIESAHDPFFTRESTGKLVLQRLKHLKYELRLTLAGKDRSSAVASFNNHEDFFGRAFAVRRRDGREAHSGCVAFGLERWVNAFCAQHGVDPARWPARVRAAVREARR
jgi:seryl-tRNA synthetase